MDDIMMTISPKEDDTSKKIWNYFMAKHRIANPYGVAALMGNLQYESVMNPKAFALCDTKQDRNPQFTKAREELYCHVIPGGGMFFDMNEFVLDKNIGFGLPGWQWWARKQGLYNTAKMRGLAVGDLDAQLAFIWDELNGPSRQDLLVLLRNTGDIGEASLAVAKKYIRDQIKYVNPKSFIEREAHSLFFFETFGDCEEGKRWSKATKSYQKPCEVNKWVRVMKDLAPVKTRPTMLSRTIGKAFLSERFPYVVTSKNGKWYCITWPMNSILGWVPAKATKIEE